LIAIFNYLSVTAWSSTMTMNINEILTDQYENLTKKREGKTFL